MDYKKWEEKKQENLLDFLVKKKAVQAYPVLIEVNEQTFIPNEKQNIRLFQTEIF